MSSAPCRPAGVTLGAPADYTLQGDPVPKMFNAFNGLGIMVRLSPSLSSRRPQKHSNFFCCMLHLTGYGILLAASPCTQFDTQFLCHSFMLRVTGVVDCRPLLLESLSFQVRTHDHSFLSC